MTRDERLRREALEIFEGFRRELAHLEMRIATVERGVDIEVSIPKQPGLDFGVHLNFQNGDELGLGAGDVFFATWFPSDDPDVVRRYREAVIGVLEGRYRVVEYHRRGRGIGADLQAPAAAGWVGVKHYRRGLFPFTLGASTGIIRNGAALFPAASPRRSTLE